MELRKGFKQSEIGLIPKDWDVKLLQNIGKFSKGAGIKKDEALSGEIPCVRYGEIYTRHDYFIREFHSFISKEVSITAKKLKEGDILFAGSGETKEEIGKCIAYVKDIGAYAGGDIVILSPENDNPMFLGYLLNAPFVQKQKASRGQGDAVVHISASQLGSVLIPLPSSKAEQSAIATALSDMDNLIAGLEKLIEKKKAIKQGAMHELMRPKGGWVVKRLGDVLRIKHGKSQKDVVEEDGKYPILASGGVIGRSKSFLYDKPSVLIGRKGTIDCPQYKETPFWCVDTLFYSEVSHGYDAKFIFYVFSLIDWYSYNEASGVPSLNAKSIEQIEKFFPKTKEEQSNIASVLTEMDDNIELHKKHLEKVKMLKQGMMQDLLTGKTRLVKNGN